MMMNTTTNQSQETAKTPFTKFLTRDRDSESEILFPELGIKPAMKNRLESKPDVNSDNEEEEVFSELGKTQNSMKKMPAHQMEDPLAFDMSKVLVFNMPKVTSI